MEGFVKNLVESEMSKTLGNHSKKSSYDKKM